MIFGSYAKGTQKKGSDLDVFVAGKYTRKEIEKVSDLYKIHIAIKKYPMEMFEKHVKDDILIKEMLGNHIIFKGAEEFIEIVR